jgi:hypothetical protein
MGTMIKLFLKIIFIVFSFNLSGQQIEITRSLKDINTIKFICITGIFNNYPMLDTDRHNELIKHLLNEVENEKPAFVFLTDIATDLLGKNPIIESIIYHCEGYYPEWLKMMSQFKINYYSVMGPNEVGGELWNEQKTKVFDLYKSQHNKYMQMPQMGGKGLYYWIAYKNYFIVVLDAYDKSVEYNSRLVPNIGKEQLDWLNNTLRSHNWFKYKIVIAHSSRLLGKGYQNSNESTDIEKNETNLHDILMKNDIDYFLAFDDLPPKQKAPDEFRLLNFSATRQFPDKLQFLIFSEKESEIEIIKKEKVVKFKLSDGKRMIDFKSLSDTEFKVIE